MYRTPAGFSLQTPFVHSFWIHNVCNVLSHFNFCICVAKFAVKILFFFKAGRKTLRMFFPPQEIWHLMAFWTLQTCLSVLLLAWGSAPAILNVWMSFSLSSFMELNSTNDVCVSKWRKSHWWESGNDSLKDRKEKQVCVHPIISSCLCLRAKWFLTHKAPGWPWHSLSSCKVRLHSPADASLQDRVQNIHRGKKEKEKKKSGRGGWGWEVGGWGWGYRSPFSVS